MSVRRHLLRARGLRLLRGLVGALLLAGCTDEAERAQRAVPAAAAPVKVTEPSEASVAPSPAGAMTVPAAYAPRPGTKHSLGSSG